MNLEGTLLAQSHFPAAPASVDVAVSGGPDSLGLLLLAVRAGLLVHVHHVDHHVRPTSTDESRHVRAICERLGVLITCHDVHVAPGGNFESRARSARRSVLPDGALTGHTMDDLAETVLLNMMRGAGVDGLSPMVADPSKPLRDVRRSDLHYYVAQSVFVPIYDESNEDPAFLRNRVRHELLPVMCDIAGRDIVPLLARQASVIYEDRRWLERASLPDLGLEIDDVDCRDLRDWEPARLRRWLRARLSHHDADGTHPPSSDEVDRAMTVIRGDVVATELAGGARLSRSGQRLTLD